MQIFVINTPISTCTITIDFHVLVINILVVMLASGRHTCVHSLYILVGRETIMIGFTELSEVEVKEIILQLGEQFAGNVYHVLNRWGVS